MLSDLKAQSFNMNLANEKYWYYRQRLMYFVKPGLKQGESNVAGRRNTFRTYILDFGDQPSDLSYYIGVLATEYKLLSDNHNVNGVDNSAAINNTLLELYYAFEAFKRLDECETDFPWTETQTKYDGFFCRDVVVDEILSGGNQTLFIDETGNLEYFNKGLSPNQSYPDGYPDYVDGVTADYGGSHNTMSQDLAIYSLVGFALTVKCLPDHTMYFTDNETGLSYSCNFEEYAQEISYKILTYISSNAFWTIKDPKGVPVENGANAYGYSYGIWKAVSYITQTSSVPVIINDLISISNTMLPTQRTLWNALQYLPSPTNTYNDAMVSTLAAIGDSWRFPQTTINSSFFGINYIASNHHWETFYTLLWQYLHDKNRNLEIQMMEDQIASAPCDGPFSYVDFTPGDDYCADGGWGSRFKWRSGLHIQNNGDTNMCGNYNGLDYMLLYNLYRLVEQPVGYVNLIDRYINADFPFQIQGSPSVVITYGNDQNAAYIQAFNSITSVSKIYNAQNSNGLGDGNVTYRAGESITLKPGFHAEPGAYFHAYIDPLECNGGQYRNSAYSDTPMFTVYDSLLCAENYFESDNFDNNMSDDEYYDEELVYDNAISVYPNPTRGTFTLKSEFEIENGVFIQIINAMGEVVYSESFASFSNVEMDISGFAEGLYVLYFISDNIKYTEKIILAY